MKGVTFAQAGAEPKLVDDLEQPKPGPDQILVKSLWAAINPVDAFLSNYVEGMLPWPLVLSWPLVIAVDASGVIVEAGADATANYGLNPGDYVCGCTRLGSSGYSAGQEYLLMDAAVTIQRPKNIDAAQAATIGVGLKTAALGLFEGLNIDLPDPDSLPPQKDEWVVILGGASSVGKFATQLAKAAGYKVIASCSGRSQALVENLGAATFDYKESIEQQVQRVLEVTEGKVDRVLDAMAADDPEIAKELFKKSKAQAKYFATTNDWSMKGDFEGGKTYNIELGEIGRPHATVLNNALKSYVPVFKRLIECGAVSPSEYHVVGSGGFEDLIEAYKFQLTGQAGSKKVVVKLQSE